MEALRQRIYDLEGLLADRKAQIADAVEMLVSPDLNGDEERINKALGILEEE